MIVVAGQDSPPYYFIDSQGQPQGWLIDLWQLWAAKVGRRLTFRMMPFSESIGAMERGEADIHAGLFYSDERRRQMDFVFPVINVSTHFFHHKNIYDIHAIQDLLPFRIGVIEGDYALEYLQSNLPQATLSRYPNNEELFKAIEQGQIKVFVKDTAIAQWMLSQRNLLYAFQHLEDNPLYTKPFMAAVSKGDKALASLILEGMRQITAEESAVIDHRWPGISTSRRPEVLIVSGAQDNAPFSMLSPAGEPTGMLIDLWRLWSERTGRPVEFRLTDRKTSLDMVARKEADVACGLLPSPANSLWLEYSDQIYPLDISLFKRAGSALDSMADVGERVVGVLRHSWQEDRVRQLHPTLRLQPFNDLETMIAAVKEDRIAGFVGETVASQAAIDRMGFAGRVEQSGSRLFVDYLHAATIQGRPDLLNQVNKGMQAITNKEILDIERTWIQRPQSRLFTEFPRDLPLTDAEKEWLKQHPDIRLGIDANWPPFEFVDDKAVYKGIASEYVELINAKLGIAMRPQTGLSWAEVLDQARSGGVDAIPCITPSKERQEFLLFTSPYLKVRNVIASRRDSPFLDGLDDLDGKRVAIVRGYLVQKLIARDYPGIDIVPVDDIAQGITMVEEGQADAFVDNLVSISFVLRKLDTRTVAVSATTPYASELGFGIRKDWPMLTAILEKVLQSIPEQEKQRIHNRWVGLQVERSVDWRFVRRVILAVVAVSALVMGFIGVWNRRLAREVHNRLLAEKELSDQLMFQVTLIDTLPNPILIKDPLGRYAGCNKAYEELFGVSRTDIAGKTVLERPDLPEEMRRRLHAEDRMLLRDRSRWFGELAVTTPDGQPHAFLYWKSVFTLSDGRLGGMLGVMVDITDRKTMEAELLQAKDTAEAATRSKSDFLANMSHEIRTPMNAIIGLTHLALQTEMSPKQQDYLSKISASSRSLLAIINDILDFSKIEAGGLHLEKVDFPLEDVFANLANLFTVKAQDKGLELLFSIAPDVPPRLQGDPLRLGQILTNLVANALKFTEKGEIVISVHPAAKSNQTMTLQFEVRDTGIGMREDEQKRLFAPFSQADSSTTRKFGGTGLGLAISKRLVEMMDGRIWVDSRPNLGSTFFCTATFGVPTQLADAAPRVREDFRNTRALVVDDNLSSRLILGEALESFGLRVAAAESGEEALALLEAADADKPFSLVLMDWKMPGMDGLEASRRIKRHTGLGHVPAIILVTGFGLGEMVQEAFREGLEGVLVKPVGQSELFEAVLAALGRGRSGEVPPLRPHPEPLRIAEDVRSSRVLLVEDNELNRQVAREILESAGLEVSEAHDGQTALNLAHDSHFDAVLMDIQMPGMDGFAATALFREQPRFASLPIIAMTAHAMEGDREKSLAAGMDDHVTKPIDPQYLIATLSRHLRRHLQPAAAPLPTPDSNQPVEMLPQSIEGVDMNEGLLRIGHNRKLYHNLLVKFRDEYAEAPAATAQHLAEARIEDARRLVHSIKGIAGNLGIHAVFTSASRLETALQDKRITDYSSYLQTFSKDLKTVMDHLQHIPRTEQTLRPAGADEEAEPEAVLFLLEQLIPGLQARKPKKCEPLMTALSHLHWPEHLYAEAEQLLDLTRRYQFKEALALTNHLMTRLQGRP